MLVFYSFLLYYYWLNVRRLNIVFELELTDSVYLRFMKKFKMNKDKSVKTLAANNNTSLQGNNFGSAGAAESGPYAR